jgi:hypothetical protein
VRAELSLKDGQTQFRTGEPIVLDLAITADDPGYSINTTTAQLGSQIDDITVTPSDGVFDWLAGHRFSLDYASVADLKPGQTEHLEVLLNSVYRFDKPGNYTVNVTTTRVYGSSNASQRVSLTTNGVTISLTSMAEADEQTIVNNLMQSIRNAPDLETAQSYVNHLTWLTGEPSTRAKVDLFFHPQVYEPFGTDVTQALWVARDRELVVKLLEQSLTDPSHPVDAALPLAAAMKATLKVPQGPNAAQPTKEAEEQFEEEYVRQVAATLAQRSGPNLSETAETLLRTYAAKGETNSPQFAAAQEVLITHFSEVSPWHQDTLLNSFGQYLADQRIVPALKTLLGEKTDDTFLITKSAALNMLMRLAPEEGRPYVVEAACNPAENIQFQVLAKLPADTLPEIDKCLLSELRTMAPSGGDRTRSRMNTEAMLAGRFATKSIYPQMLALYQQYGSKWPGQVRAGMLAYLARYDTQGGLKLLQSDIPLDSNAFNTPPLSALCRSYYSPAVDMFFRGALQREEPRIAGDAAYEMSLYGTVEDEPLLRARLAKWQKEWAGREAPSNEYMLEAELIHGLIAAKNWHEDEATTETLKSQCTADVCRKAYNLGADTK